MNTVEHVGTRATRRWVVGMMLYLAPWYWLAHVVVVTGIAVPLYRTDNLDGSMLGGSLMSPVFFALVLGIIVPAAALSSHVAAGGTRRSFWRGMVEAALVSGLLFGPVIALLMLAERWVFTSLGLAWSPPTGMTGGLAASLVAAGVALALAVATALLVGAAIAVGYYRRGPWGGTLLVPVLLLPLALALLVGPLGLEVGLVRSVLPDSAGPLLAVGAAAGALALVASAVVLRLTVRHVPIRPRT